MSAPGSGIGISFHETMQGGFDLGPTDPAAGERQGQRAGSRMAMHAAIAIDDLAAFIADPNHLGALRGTLDLTPFGDGIPATKGVFNLFNPTSDPKLKLMVYELGFEHAGQSFYLAGRKEVREDPITDLWKATTTLYSQLHEGADKNGPVVGAGILSLGITDLLALVKTVKVTGTTSPAEKAEALGRFGSFFLGELWDTYVKHVLP
jgi:hypothetical protein